MQLAFIAIAGTLLGVFIGHVLTASREHRKWLADQKKAEYRELIDQLYETVTVVLENKMKMDSDEKARETVNTAVKKLARIFEDRIFIAQELEKLKIKEDWLGLKRVLHARADERETLAKEFWYSDHNVQERENALRKKLVGAANREIVQTRIF
jgi:hypothetical protein